MKVAILQPMYLPWMGYFALMHSVDVFVFYDDVQFVERSWQRRNRIKLPNGKWMWLTVPVIKKFGQNINEVKINNTIEWKNKHWKAIVASYAQAPFFDKFSPHFREIYHQDWEYLIDLNITLIKRISRLIGIKVPQIILSSELNPKGKKTDRLIDILLKLGAEEYVSGPAAKSYIEPEKFKRAGIHLYWFEYHHPIYPQIHGDFVPYLSAIDLVFNVGDKSLKVLIEGLENALVLDKRTVCDHV